MLAHFWRLPRLVLSIIFVIFFASLYIFYPDRENPPRAGEVEYRAYEAGGIDSDHWRRPVRPNFEQEEGRAWRDEVCFGDDCERLDDDEIVPGRKGTTSGAALALHDGMLGGGVIMPKLGNETAKAELGRAAWRVLHLMTMRFPDEPTADDRLALKSYMHLFSRLYPCGECASEFQKLLKQYPPQTSSRKSASLWLCHVHNLVNARLGKPEFDCLTLDETYDCGCGPEASAAPDTAASRTAAADEDAYEVDTVHAGVDAETGTGTEALEADMAETPGWGEARGQWQDEGGRGAAAAAAAGVGVGGVGVGGGGGGGGGSGGGGGGGAGAGARLGSELGGSKYGWKGEVAAQRGREREGGRGAAEAAGGVGVGAQLGSELGGSRFGWKGDVDMEERGVDTGEEEERDSESEEERDSEREEERDLEERDLEERDLEERALEERNLEERALEKREVER